MPGTLRHLTGQLRGAFALMLALVVALRVVAAPVVLGPAEAGLIPVCAGGQIYYVTLDGTPVDADAPEGDPCPFLGIALILESTETPMPVARDVAVSKAAPMPERAIIAIAKARANTARAPPLNV